MTRRLRVSSSSGRRTSMVVGLLAVLAVLTVVGVTSAVGNGSGAGEEAAAPEPDPLDEAPAIEPTVEPEPDLDAPEPDPEALEADSDAPASDLAPEPGETPRRERLVVHHVGDVNLDPRQLPILDSDGPSSVWDGARDTFAEADIVIVNLECAPTRGGVAQDKSFVFRCDLDALPAMRDAGVTVVTLAHNHRGDYGVAEMVAGVDNVEAAGIATVGVGRDEDAAYRPHIVEVAGWRVAILGFGGVVPVASWTARGELGGQATGYDAQRMAEAVAAAKADADLVVATVHWGNEGALEPRSEDVRKAEAMIAAGADLVVGHHAHRLQPLERIDDVPVFWNLGNFVWPRHSAAGSVTAVAEWVVEPDGEVRACLRPFEIGDRGVPAPTGAEPTCR